MCQDFAPGTEVVIEGRDTIRRKAVLAMVPHARIAEVSGFQRASRHSSAAGQDHRSSASQFGAELCGRWESHAAGGRGGEGGGVGPAIAGYNVQLSSSDGPLEQIAKIKGDNLRMRLGGSICVSHANLPSGASLRLVPPPPPFDPRHLAPVCRRCSGFSLPQTRGVQRHGRGLGISRNAATLRDWCGTLTL